MCGIVGITRKEGERGRIAPTLLDGLRRLEYRGYDSAGICLSYKTDLLTFKSVGRVNNLDRVIPDEIKVNETFVAGIAHTRWATHGGVTEENAHPHLSMDGTIAVVHNGIIDNADELRDKLIKLGYTFRSETDTEILAQLLQYYRERCTFPDRLDNIMAMVKSAVKGTYGMAALFNSHPGAILAARMGSPLIIGLADNATYVASDLQPILPFTNRVIYLEDGDIFTVMPDIVDVGYSREPTIQCVDIEDSIAEIGSYDSFMLKEINEQPAAIKRCFAGRIRDNNCILGGFNFGDSDVSNATSVTIVGCGTSYHAGLFGASLIREFAGIPCNVEIASEYSTGQIIKDPNGIYLAISQSGETFDTIECIKELRSKGIDTYGIVNTVGSTIARLCGRGVYIHAGPEIAVASTKAFTSQMAALSMFSIMIGRAKRLGMADGERLCSELRAIPELVERQLSFYSNGPGLNLIKDVSEKLAGAKYALFLGRGPSFPVALEGALKLKEIAYIPCEAYPGGEMKHGPIAMIEKGTPVLALNPRDSYNIRMLSNIKEVEARGAEVIEIIPQNTPPFYPFSAFLTIIPLQLIAYHTARRKGLDIDKPRNLAKSVTV